MIGRSVSVISPYPNSITLPTSCWTRRTWKYMYERAGISSSDSAQFISFRDYSNLSGQFYALSSAELSNYLRQGGYVSPGVCLIICLSVCLLAASRKNYWSDLHDNFMTDVPFDKEDDIKSPKVTRIDLGGCPDFPAALVLYCILKLCTVISTLIWAVLAVLWIGFYLTGPISPCLESFVFMFVFLCVFILSYCMCVALL